jgi:hypothetical protein
MCGQHFYWYRCLNAQDRNEAEALPRSDHLEFEELTVDLTEQGLQIKMASENFDLYPLSEA